MSIVEEAIRSGRVDFLIRIHPGAIIGDIYSVPLFEVTGREKMITMGTVVGILVLNSFANNHLRNGSICSELYSSNGTLLKRVEQETFRGYVLTNHDFYLKFGPQ